MTLCKQERKGRVVVGWVTPVSAPHVPHYRRERSHNKLIGGLDLEPTVWANRLSTPLHLGTQCLREAVSWEMAISRRPHGHTGASHPQSGESTHRPPARGFGPWVLIVKAKPCESCSEAPREKDSQIGAHPRKKYSLGPRPRLSGKPAGLLRVGTEGRGPP